MSLSLIKNKQDQCLISPLILPWTIERAPWVLFTFSATKPDVDFYLAILGRSQVTLPKYIYQLNVSEVKMDKELRDYGISKHDEHQMNFDRERLNRKNIHDKMEVNDEQNKFCV